MKLPSDLITPVIRSPGSWYTEAGPGTPFRSILKRLQNGQNICLTGTYGFAMSFYAWLKKYVEQRFPVSDYPSSRRHRKALFSLQSRIWISFRDHFPELMKSPANPWISAFYPETGVFLMTFTDYLGMNGAWQWFQKGIQYPVLNHLVHPFYGTYFPSRYDHLTLFDRWVPEHRNFRRVLDIGCGCGILSFILLKHGIREIHATDINPNAVFSFRQDIHRVFGDGQNDLFIEKADLLGSFVPGAGDLILFNPPWIPEPPEKELDRATYFEEGYFDRFFEEMAIKCPKGTRVLLLFSNFCLISGITSEHPIEQALLKQNGTFQCIALYKEGVKQAPGNKKSWLRELREKEEVELFVIERV